MRIAVPRPCLFTELIELVKAYPAPQELRDVILDDLYLRLEALDCSTLTSDERVLVLKLLATRSFSASTSDAARNLGVVNASRQKYSKAENEQFGQGVDAS